MSNYTKITDFAVKDSLLTGNPLKLITGTAHDNEYNAISTAIATKVDSGGALGTPSSGTLTNCTGLPLAGVTDSTTEALGVGSLELGHASDTTLTRASAGVLAVEGVNVLTTATGAALAGSVSQAFSVASLEVGNASDTTITRASAGTIAVEGVNILTTATGAALAGSASQAFSTSVLTAASATTPSPFQSGITVGANKTNGSVYGGVYTPTLTGVTNVAASTAFPTNYVRVDNIVTVSGIVAIDPTAGATLTTLGMSLPIASNFVAVYNLGGAAVTSATGDSWTIAADGANDRAQIDITPSGAGNVTYTFVFTYQIL